MSFSSGTSICTYDANGNTTTKTDSTGTTNYAWDFENRLTSVTLPGSGGTVSYAYDPFGRRIRKVSNSGTSIYAYDNDSLIEETNASGAAVARYAQSRSVDEPLAMLRGRVADRLTGRMVLGAASSWFSRVRVLTIPVDEILGRNSGTEIRGRFSEFDSI